MKRAEAVKTLTECAAELRTRFGVSELSLFGSVARDEAREDSDVDVMVSFLSTPSFTSFMELKEYLLWASNTSNVAPKQLVMQADGNVTLLKTDNTVAWSTKTSGNTGAILSVQDDGNLVVYKRDSCSAAWARR